MINCVCNFIFVMYMLSCNTLYYILCRYQIYITITYLYLYVIISGSVLKGKNGRSSASTRLDKSCMHTFVSNFI